MNVEPVSLLTFVATAFVVFGAAGAVATWIFGRGRVGAGRALLFVIWFFGAVAVASIGYRQYGFWAAPPAAMAVGLSMALVYAIARRGGGQSRWLLAAARGSIAAILATALLPVSLLLFLVMLGIDGP
jgi:hypothetical protein